MFKHSKTFIRDLNGSVAMIFAMALPVIAVGAGAAVDYSAVSGARSSLQSSSDSAALAAARVYLTNGGNKTAAEAAGLAAMKANFEITNAGKATLAASSVVMTVNEPPTFTATSSASVKNSFSSYFSGSASNISVEAVAQIRAKGGSSPTLEEVPTDLIIAMDVSGSMGLAASLADRNKMYAAVGAENAKYGAPAESKTCAFACHGQNWGPSSPKTPLEIARDNNVTLRFDVEKSMVLNTIETLLKTNNKADHRVGVFKFADTLTLVEDMSKNQGQLKKAVNAVDFESKGTFFEVVFPELRTKITDMIANKKLRPEANKTLLIMTDGMRTRPWADDTLDIYAIKESSCNFFKTLGINVAIVELKYIPETVQTHGNYAYFATQFPLIGPTLKSCASSPNLYGQAADMDEIIKEFNRVMTSSVTATTKTPVLIR
jgi:Flp pilus assembly protein TadG